MTDAYACYTGENLACTSQPYEDLADALTAALGGGSTGKQRAQIALRVIGAHAVAQTERHMLSDLLRTYGKHLIETSVAVNGTPLGVHKRSNA